MKKETENKQKSFRRQLGERFLFGILYGLGQALGLTLIFALLLTYLARFLSALGGIPYLGTILADVIKATENALGKIR